jgi:hypothetical protein
MIEDLLQIHRKPMQVTRASLLEKPTPGTVKINSDAAFYGERGTGATGIVHVVRNEHGELANMCWGSMV